MKIKKSCPECGGIEIYTKAVGATGGYGPDLLPGVGGFFSKKQFELYICAKCGHTQFFVPEKWLQDIREKYQRA